MSRWSSLGLGFALQQVDLGTHIRKEWYLYFGLSLAVSRDFTHIPLTQVVETNVAVPTQGLPVPKVLRKYRALESTSHMYIYVHTISIAWQADYTTAPLSSSVTNHCTPSTHTLSCISSNDLYRLDNPTTNCYLSPQEYSRNGPSTAHIGVMKNKKLKPSRGGQGRVINYDSTTRRTKNRIEYSRGMPVYYHHHRVPGLGFS